MAYGSVDQLPLTSQQFNYVSCDMHTSAIAIVAAMSSLPSQQQTVAFSTTDYQEHCRHHGATFSKSHLSSYRLARMLF